MDIAGIDQRLIGWQSTRRQQIEDALPVLTARYEERQGHAPGERAAYALACQAADQTRAPKRTELLSLTELRKRWRDSAIRAFGACTVYRLAERARAAAAAVWARVRPVVDLALAAVDTVAVVYVMRGAFKRHHLLAEARRHLSYVLRGRSHQPGLDEQIVQTVVDGYTRPASRRMMTADLRALYPRDTEDQAVLRPLTRKRTATPYERARLAADTLATGSAPAGRTAASWSRRPASTRWSRPAGPSKPPRSWPPSSVTARENAPLPTAPDRNPPRRRTGRRTPRSPAFSTRRAGPQEELPEKPGRKPRPRAATPEPRPGCGTPTPGCGDDAGHRPPSGAHWLCSRERTAVVHAFGRRRSCAVFDVHEKRDSAGFGVRQSQRAKSVLERITWVAVPPRMLSSALRRHRCRPMVTARAASGATARASVTGKSRRQ